MVYMNGSQKSLCDAESSRKLFVRSGAALALFNKYDCVDGIESDRVKDTASANRSNERWR